LDKDVSTRSFDDCTQETVAEFDRCLTAKGCTRSRVLARHVDSGHGQSVDRLFADRALRRSAARRTKLAFPALDVGVNASTLTRAEKIDAALGLVAVA